MPTATLTLADGTQKTLTGTREEIIAEAGRIEAENRPRSTGQNIAQGLSEGLLGLVTGVPEFVARGARGGSNLIRSAMGDEMIPIPPEGLLGLPTGREAAAGIEAFIKNPTSAPGLPDLGPGFGSDFQSAVQQRDKTGKGVAFGAGNAIASGLGLAAGRSPKARAVAEPLGIENVSGVIKAKTGIVGLVDDIAKSKLVRNLDAATAKALETGVESAVLAALDNQDPREAGLLGAGAQIGGGAMIYLMADPIKRLAPAVATMAVVHQMLKEITPGGDNYILPSIESGVEHAMAVIALGALSKVSGLGAGNDTLKKNLPVFTDAMLAIPRGTLLAAMNAATQDAAVRKTVEVMATDPSAFTSAQQERISRAIKSGKLDKEVPLMMQQKKFSDIIGAKHPKLAGVPSKEDSK